MGCAKSGSRRDERRGKLLGTEVARGRGRGKNVAWLVFGWQTADRRKRERESVCARKTSKRSQQHRGQLI